MTSTQSRIVASSQQTRFHLNDHAAPGSLHISGIDLSVVSELDQSNHHKDATSSSQQLPPRRRPADLDILTDAELRLDRAVCYALIGRNGSGKSTLIRAIHEKVIPGLPIDLKVGCLQQTERNTNAAEATDYFDRGEDLSALPVIQYVTMNDPVIIKWRKDLDCLTGRQDDATDAEQDKALFRYRNYLHYQEQTNLRRKQMQAQLQSGARGAKARKELLTAQAKAAEVWKRTEDIPEDITTPEVQAELREAADIVTDLQDKLAALSVDGREKTVMAVLVGLGYTAPMMQKPVRELSGGWRMRCELATALVQTSDLLILDEPTNYLDLLGIMWLQQYIDHLKANEDKIIIVVSHDRDFVDAVCDETIVLRDKTLNYFSGNVTEYESDLRSRIKYLSRMQEAQDREADRAKKSIASTIKQGKKKGDDNALRMAKSKAKKLETQSGMLKSATGGRFKLSRDRIGWQDSKVAAIEIPTFETGVSMTIPGVTELRSAGPLLSLERASFRYNKSETITIKEASLTLHMGDRIGIMGVNGSGKSTLTKVLLGELEPSSGKSSFHPQLKLGYYSQHAVESLKTQGRDQPGVSALALIRQSSAGTLSDQDARALLGSFGLSGRTASDVPFASLSGGQLVRLALAIVLSEHPNLLVLDEISTHLDHHTVTALADALSEYEGAIVLVSHDRFLMKRVIEGMKDPADEGSENSDEDDLNGGTGRRQILVMKNGRLRLQADGVDGYEQSVEKMLAKLV
ncbi:hypothetical protein CAC42_7338 [Sphaceloma murrayae]|uniref:ABC transporter domain-containing protein n=1 Tax=Sphaceloma murrayae TaxID=2082308 RepID=A0A2K1QWR4_9PEZI|nr:hypothetical protein CAC42_7338 [Sphaceloma murrayae]